MSKSPLMGGSESQSITFNGDQGIRFEDRDGTRYSIQRIGIGHPIHTVITRPGDSPRGGVATDAEATLMWLLITQNEAAGHEHDWQANGTTTKVVELEGGFVRAKRTFAIQSCACGRVRELFVSEERWRPYA